MKQRIRVAGIVRKGDLILMLKKKRGRMEELPTWELPTGKINFGEQPEEAIGRLIYESLGVQVDEIRLKDVVTFVGLERSSQLGNIYIIYEVLLDPALKIDAKGRYTAYKYVKEEDLLTLKLDEATMSVLEIEGDKNMVNIPVVKATNLKNDGKQGKIYRGMTEAATVYVDGGSRGNPGPSGIGYYIEDVNGNMIKHGGMFIGFASSRMAEYFALKEGCEQAIELGLKRVRFVSDSLMLVNQMNGVYKIKNKDVIPVYEDIKKLFEQFDAVAIIHKKREFTEKADKEVNLAINRHFDVTDDSGGHTDA